MSDELKIAYEKGISDLERMNSEEFIFKNCLLTMFTSFEAIAWFEFLENKNLDKAKNAFYNCALTDIELCNFGYDLFSYKRNSPLYAALSDNKSVQKEFAKIEYTIRSGPNKNKTNKQIASKGNSHIYIDSVVQALCKNMDALKKNLTIMKENLLKMKKGQPLLIDTEFLEGIVEDNPDKIQQAIKTLGTKQHKSRNRHSFFYKDLVSQPAMGYAKIAWINGFEISMDLPLIYNELLPISPSSEYTNEVSLMKGNMTLEPEDPNYNGRKKRAITQ